MNKLTVWKTELNETLLMYVSECLPKMDEVITTRTSVKNINEVFFTDEQKLQK